MINNPTDNIINSLKNCTSIEQFLESNEDNFINSKLCNCLCQKVIEKGLTKASVIKKAEISEIYGYQLFSGVSYPSRDTLICLCVGMGLNIDETQELLKVGGFASLYPRNRRDSIIMLGIKNKLSLCDINETLYSNNENNFNQFK